MDSNESNDVENKEDEKALEICDRSTEDPVESNPSDESSAKDEEKSNGIDEKEEEGKSEDIKSDFKEEETENGDKKDQETIEKEESKEEIVHQEAPPEGEKKEEKEIKEAVSHEDPPEEKKEEEKEIKEDLPSVSNVKEDEKIEEKEEVKNELNGISSSTAPHEIPSIDIQKETATKEETSQSAKVAKKGPKRRSTKPENLTSPTRMMIPSSNKRLEKISPNKRRRRRRRVNKKRGNGEDGNEALESQDLNMSFEEEEEYDNLLKSIEAKRNELRELTMKKEMKDRETKQKRFKFLKRRKERFTSKNLGKIGKYSPKEFSKKIPLFIRMQQQFEKDVLNAKEIEMKEKLLERRKYYSPQKGFQRELNAFSKEYEDDLKNQQMEFEKRGIPYDQKDLHSQFFEGKYRAKIRKEMRQRKKEKRLKQKKLQQKQIKRKEYAKQIKRPKINARKRKEMEEQILRDLEKSKHLSKYHRILPKVRVKIKPVGGKVNIIEEENKKIIFKEDLEREYKKNLLRLGNEYIRSAFRRESENVRSIENEVEEIEKVLDREDVLPEEIVN